MPSSTFDFLQAESISLRFGIEYTGFTIISNIAANFLTITWSLFFRMIVHIRSISTSGKSIPCFLSSSCFFSIAEKRSFKTALGVFLILNLMSNCSSLHVCSYASLYVCSYAFGDFFFAMPMSPDPLINSVP